MSCRAPGFPVLHYLPEFAQTHVHWVRDAIQPSHPLPLLSPALNLSQNQRFSQWVDSASGGQTVAASASVLPVNIQGWFPLGWTGFISSMSKGLSKESFPAPQSESINSLVLSLLYGPALTFIHDYWKNHSFDYTDLCQQSWLNE